MTSDMDHICISTPEERTKNKDIHVLVTGAGGFVAGHIIRTLVAHGYTVRGTVRALDDKEKYGHLAALFPTLELHQADNLHEGSYDQAVEGCQYVIHTASPFTSFFEYPADPQKDVVDPAVKGTLNVLSACRKAGVKRLVLTSSLVAVEDGSKPEGFTFSNSDWNTEADVSKDAYGASKVQAEQAARTFGQPPEIVSVNPGLVLGPPLSKRTDATSVQFVASILDGTFKNMLGGIFGAVYAIADVRDVAKVHVAAMRDPTAVDGRFLVCAERGMDTMSIVNLIKDVYKRAICHCQTDDLFIPAFPEVRGIRVA